MNSCLSLITLSITVIIIFLCAGPNQLEAAATTTDVYKFSEQHFGVWFDGRVSKYDQDGDSYNIDEMVTFVSKIYSKFKIVVMPPFEPQQTNNDPNIDMLEIPKAVAMFNKVHKPPGGRPMQLIMLFKKKYKNSGGAGSSGNNGNIDNGFEMVRQIADKANSIYKKTVQTLLLGAVAASPNGTNMTELSEELQELISRYPTNANNNASLQFQYNLGVVIPLQDCGSSSNSKDGDQIASSFHRVLSSAQFILFSNHNHSSDSKESSSGEELFADIDICKRKISTIISLSTEIGFLTWWPATEGNNNSVSAVQHDFTTTTSTAPTSPERLLNAYAVATNTIVVARGAFDLSDEFLFRNAPGWWTLVDNVFYRSASDFVFQAKDEVVDQAGLTTASSSGSTSSSSSFLGPTTNMNLKANFSHKYFGVWFSPYVSQEDSPRKNWNNKDSYSVDELIILISKVHSEFRLMIMEPIYFGSFTPEGDDKSEIPRAVALFNKYHRPSGESSPMQLIMLFEASDFKPTKRLADEANQLFPQTVKLLLMTNLELDEDKQDYYFIERDARNAKEMLKSSDSHSHQYELGALVHFSACGPSRTKLGSELSGILSPFDRILLHMGEMDGDVRHAINKLSKWFRNCESKLVARSPQLKLGVISNWPAYYRQRTPGGERRLATDLELVDYWKGMNEWARGSSTMVILESAFDIPKNPFPNIEDFGWWRLVESASYGNASDYVFEAKEDPIIPAKKTPVGLVLSLNFSVHEDITVFSHKHVGIWFDPFVPKEDKGQTDLYNIGNLVSMISTIYSKFRILLMRPITLEMAKMAGHDILEIPKAAAMFNKRQLAPGQQPIQLMMQFEFENKAEDDDAGAGGRRRTSFEIVKELADEANVIYPKTVETLIAHGPTFNKESLNATIKLIKTIKKKCSSSKYKLGVSLPLDRCACRARADSSIIPLAPHFQLALFTLHPTEAQLKEGIRSALPQLSEAATICKEKLKRYASSSLSMETWFVTRWPENVRELLVRKRSTSLTFWKWMSGWAVRTNSRVVMFEAFDNPERAQPLDSCGWWREVGRNATHFGFDFLSKEEMLRAALPKTKNEEEPLFPGEKEAEGSSALQIVFAFSGTFLFVLIFFGASTWLILKRFPPIIFARAGRTLAREDLRMFYEGKATTGFSGHDALTTASAGIEELGYDRSLEIAKHLFSVDKQFILGAGNFGAVFKGKVDFGTAEVRVAVKTTKPSCPATALKGLLSEIKVMTYVGKHEFVVGIVGAYTEELSAGKLLVFTELCTLGSLKRYLQETKASLLHNLHGQTEPSTSAGLNLQPLMDNEVNVDLEMWSTQIVCGMAFLASKRVVHADLAARNVLLTEDKVAKISDFGLSRRLIDYEDYVKKQQEPLPWRWMAPESLTQMVFNEKTDVWSFGITLWEIFSLGDTPYSGMSWNVDWASTLDGGIRLGKPKYDINNRHSIMNKCWLADPHSRPSFSELKSILEGRSHDDETGFSEMDYMELKEM